MKKISVTGTKGKTTVINVVAAALQKFDKNVLKVDTTGHFMNGQRRSTLEDSKQAWGLVPSVCPGRYLYEFIDKETTNDDVAILECSLGSSGTSGLGYRAHTVGVFLNVFEDHLGSSERLRTKQDIADAKDFIFRQIDRGGYAVFNADDPLVVGKLSVIPEHLGVTLLPCGLEFSHFDIDAHLQNGGEALTVKDNKIVLLARGKKRDLVNLSNMPWAFNGLYLPSVWNLLQAAAALYAYFEGALPDNFTSVIESIRLDQYGGRLTMLRGKNGTQILADYAHEKVSLVQISELARALITDGKVIGVVRLAHDRTDELIKETGQAIGAHFDELVVYDKIDGYLRHPVKVRSNRFPQVVGRTSKVLANAIKSVNPNVTRVVREDEAAAYAAKAVHPGDIVVYIVNDDIERSIGFIKDSFEADFV